MRRLLAAVLITGLVASAFPPVALAGDPHAVQNRWLGVGIGAAVVTLGGLLLGGIQAPVVVAPPPAVYAPPPVVYAPPPVVMYPSSRVIVRGDWVPPGQWGHQRHWRH
jgi:hypothetical protein